MLYVFNSANGVQIAWNAVLPAQKEAPKRRAFKLSHPVRTSSAG